MGNIPNRFAIAKIGNESLECPKNHIFTTNKVDGILNIPENADEIFFEKIPKWSG